MSRHVVVDGSNLATEGRTAPSLKQLVEAVETYMHDHPDDVITVVVDATFGHRIDPREVPEFDAAIENNEVVCPPAGAIGRGDAFVLSIAHKAGATILSNDSFQEFHGQYPWLFEEGRLVGGKPVPNVGWVFVARTPVRGPVSRRAMKDAKRGRKPEKKAVVVRASKEASLPMPVPKTPPPGPVRLRGEAPVAAAANGSGGGAAAQGGGDGRPQGKLPGKHEPINDLLPFLDFVERHPVGSEVTGVVDAFSSHGAYVLVGEARCYVPLRHLGDPAPRSAREVLQLGQERTFVVVSFNASRRGIDVADPAFAPALVDTPVVLTDADAEAAQAGGAAAADGGREGREGGRGRRRRGRGRGERTEDAGTPETVAASGAETTTGDAVAVETAPADGAAAEEPAKGRGRGRGRRGARPEAPTEAAVVPAAEPAAAAAEEAAPAKKAARKRATKKGEGVTSVVEEVPGTVPALKAPSADVEPAAEVAVAPAKKAARARKQAAPVAPPEAPAPTAAAPEMPAKASRKAAARKQVAPAEPAAAPAPVKKADKPAKAAKPAKATEPAKAAPARAPKAAAAKPTPAKAAPASKPAPAKAAPAKAAPTKGAKAPAKAAEPAAAPAKKAARPRKAAAPAAD